MDDNFLWLNTDGTIVPESEETRRLFGEQQVRFRLQPTSPNLLVAVRTPCESLPVSLREDRVVLAGDISGFPMVDLVVSLNQCRITGVLRVTCPGSERTLSFLEGELRGASSSLAAEKIGEVAVRMGLVQRQALDNMLATQRGTGRIGNMMVENGLLQRRSLYDCLRQQVTEIFSACLMVTEGTFTLTNHRIGAQKSLNINTQGLLMDSVRQMDEMKEFRKRIPSSQCCPKACKPSDADIDQKEALILQQCSGTSTISDIAFMLKLSEFDATKAVHHLLELGYINPDMPLGGNEKRMPTPEDVINVFNNIFSMIFVALKTLPRPPDIMGEATNAIRLQSELYPIFRGIQLRPDGTVSKAQLLQNIREQGAENAETAHVLYSTFSELMYFLLFELEEQLDSEADEQLSAKIKTFLEPIEAAAQ